MAWNSFAFQLGNRPEEDRGCLLFGAQMTGLVNER